MGSENRQQRILTFIDNKGEVSLVQLKELFPDISMMTLRRDLILLEKEGHLVRTYGGAVSIRKISSSPQEDTYSRRAVENVEAKTIIARKAVALVERGRSVYFDAGSTMMCLAQLLPDENFTVITSGVNIALELMKRDRTTVMLPGGFIGRNTLSISGPTAVTDLDSMNIDLAFIAASGFSIENGFTNANIYECELKRKVISRAKKVYLLMDRSKLNKDMPFTFARMDEVDQWISDGPLPFEVTKEAKKYGVVIV